MASDNIPSWARTSGNAGGDLTGKERFIVVYGSAGTWTLAGANASGLRGILLEGATVGRGVTMAIPGGGYTVVVEAGGTFNPGASVATNAAGKLVLATTGQFALGYARDGGSAGVKATIYALPHIAL